MSQVDPMNPNEEESNSGQQESKDTNEENRNVENDTVKDEEMNKDSNQSKENNLVVNETSQQANNGTKTSTGLDENIAALISYIGGFVTGIIFFVLEKDNKFVRFHALQSSIVTVAWLIVKFVLGYIPFIGWLLVLLVNGLMLALWIVCMVKAYQKQTFKIPVIGDLADQYK